MSKPAPTDPLNPFAELTRMIEQFKLPGVDMAAVTASRRKDIEALLAANKAMVDSMQELARKQAEIFAQAMQGAQDSLGAMARGGAAPDPARQTELARQAYDKAVAQMSELAEIARKAQAEAMAGIVERAHANAEEMRKLFQPK